MINTIILLGLFILVWGLYTNIKEMKNKINLIYRTVDGIKCYEMRLIKEKLGIELMDWEKIENNIWDKEHLKLKG